MVNWSSSYNDDVKERDNQRSEEELDVLITPEQVSTFENSGDARKAIKLFASFSKDPLQQLTRTDYCCMRDHLFFQIELQNSHRSGVAANMLLGEFDNAKRDGDFMLIRVKNHKTKKDYGPAKVFIKPHIYAYLNIFVNNVRNNLPVIVDGNRVFLSYNGVLMESGAISKQLNSMWQRSGVYNDMQAPPSRNMTTTIFRKSVSTAVLEHRPAASGDVANLLAHSEKTQRKHYNARRMDMSTSKGAHHVESLLRYGASSGTHSPKKSWSEEEVREIKDLFQEQIDKKNITIEMIESKRTEFVKLQYIPARKIYDKIRSIRRYQDNKSSDTAVFNLPSDTLSDRCKRLQSGAPNTSENESVESTEANDSSDEDFIPPSVSVSAVSDSLVCGKEKVFPAQDSQKLLNWCADIISSGSISKERIHLALDDTEEKREFLEYYGVDKIINRLKYEKRLRNNAKKR